VNKDKILDSKRAGGPYILKEKNALKQLVYDIDDMVGEPGYSGCQSPNADIHNIIIQIEKCCWKYPPASLGIII
jgi:hypothetical protein